jgi:AAA+ ATPase superfamily predicted ATPase
MFGAVTSFDQLSRLISRMVQTAYKKVVLIIDEVDQSANN